MTKPNLSKVADEVMQLMAELRANPEEDDFRNAVRLLCELAKDAESKPSENSRFIPGSSIMD